MKSLISMISLCSTVFLLFPSSISGLSLELVMMKGFWRLAVFLLSVSVVQSSRGRRFLESFVEFVLVARRLCIISSGFSHLFVLWSAASSITVSHDSKSGG